MIERLGIRIAIAQFEGATVLRVPPLAAGLLAATLRAAPDLADATTQIHAARVPVERAAASLADADLAGISLYTWNACYALEAARLAKARRPALVIVAGGPSVPRGSDTSGAFLAAHPWVDALVLGEGELAFADVVRAVRDGAPLHTVAGVVSREGRGSPRARLQGEDYARIGSPYLDGTFDELARQGEIPAISAAVLETNRGCPFACSFCDWGQATQSRVNELPITRIEKELEWIADRGVSYLYLVDANFGIRRRDADITRAIGRLARARGAPRFVFFHLTKNATEKNLQTALILREHGVGTQVALSMQDFEPEVLLAIRRDNILPARALALRKRCHEEGLSTVNELMLGLPSQTAASVRRSLVSALTPFPRDSFALYVTRVLENTELAEPGYRARHGIETRDVPQATVDPAGAPHVVELERLVVATGSLPARDWADAYAFGYLLSALWNQRLLQTTLHVLQFALGVDVTSFVDALLASARPRLSAVREELGRFPRAILAAEGSMLPVAGWGDRLREPVEAVCARAFDDIAGFYAEAAEEAAGCVGVERAALIREAVAWDALRNPAGAAGTVRFDHDWLDYEDRMGASPRPLARPTVVRATSPLGAGPGAGADAVALERLERSRASIERVQAALPLVATAPDSDAIRDRAREDGFVYLPRILPMERLAPMRAVVDAELSARGWLVDGRSQPALRLGRWNDTRWLDFLRVVLASEPYRALAKAPELLEVLRPILGADPQLHVGDVCRLVSPGAIDLTTPPHQDAAYLTDSTGVWTAWLPLGPCPIALGPLALLPGSHRAGLRPHARVENDDDHVVGADVAADAPWRSLDLDSGDVILFSALTLHRALPNTTADRLRVSVDFRYRPAR